MTLPISERYRLAALDWVDKDAAARLLEECKSTTLEQRKAELLKERDMPDSHAERIVKASPDWADFIRRMVNARTEANRAKINVKYLEMKFAEQQSAEANRRAEMRL